MMINGKFKFNLTCFFYLFEESRISQLYSLIRRDYYYYYSCYSYSRSSNSLHCKMNHFYSINNSFSSSLISCNCKMSYHSDSYIPLKMQLHPVKLSGESIQISLNCRVSFYSFDKDMTTLNNSYVSAKVSTWETNTIKFQAVTPNTIASLKRLSSFIFFIYFFLLFLCGNLLMGIFLFINELILGIGNLIAP